MQRCVRSAVYAEECPSCGNTNYYNDGVFDGDYTGYDLEGLVCWKCGCSWLFDCVDWVDDIEDAVLEDGREDI